MATKGKELQVVNWKCNGKINSTLRFLLRENNQVFSLDLSISENKKESQTMPMFLGGKTSLCNQNMTKEGVYYLFIYLKY